MSPQQQEKMLQLFWLIKKIGFTFKANIYLAFVKVKPSKPDADKWALIIHTEKLPFGVNELQTLVSMVADELPLKLEASEVMYDSKKCLALTFELTLQ